MHKLKREQSEERTKWRGERVFQSETRREVRRWSYLPHVVCSVDISLIHKWPSFQKFSSCLDSLAHMLLCCNHCPHCDRRVNKRRRERERKREKRKKDNILWVATISPSSLRSVPFLAAMACKHLSKYSSICSSASTPYLSFIWASPLMDSSCCSSWLMSSTTLLKSSLFSMYQWWSSSFFSQMSKSRKYQSQWVRRGQLSEYALNRVNGMITWLSLFRVPWWQLRKEEENKEGNKLKSKKIFCSAQEYVGHHLHLCPHLLSSHWSTPRTGIAVDERTKEGSN